MRENREQRIENRKQGKRASGFFCSLFTAHCSLPRVGARGFTLIETLVAITILTVAIVAPMGLAARSLASAYYARDQITSFYLAQEAIEAVRSVRDGQVLRIATDPSASSLNLFGPIPVDQPFTIDTRTNTIEVCASGTCPRLQTNGTFYGYESGWTNSGFTRTVTAHSVNTDELRIFVTVSWRTGGLQTRSFTMYENVYRWVKDGSAGSS
jgi:prepilin-type N-terminal cleavage/methylation domain-containing protein